MNRALADAFRGDGADTLLRLLRTVYFEQESRGAASPIGEAPAVADALRLKLLEPHGDHGVRLTTYGYRIANFAKEYCNWVDHGRRMPEGMAASLVEGRRLLDVGCSFGRHLATFARAGARGVGIELEAAYLELSRLFAAREGIAPPPVLQADATHLPFPEQSFDIVFCRLVLNYVPVREALREFARVLVPGGHLVLAFGTFQEGVDFLRRAKWRGNTRTIGWRLFGLLNTILLQTTGLQARVRASGRMYAVHTPTWPTPSWMARELKRQGFVPPPEGFRAHATPVVFHAVRAAPPPGPRG